MKHNIILIHAWNIHKIDNSYYLPYTHWIYLNEVVKYYDKIWLICPTGSDLDKQFSYKDISCFDNVEVYELPYAEKYIDSIKYFFHYISAYKSLSKICDVAYSRYPAPFGWLQKYFFKNKVRIIHFVGDPLDTINNNPNISRIKKRVYNLFFKPEHFLFIQACKKALVYTNGNHIVERLQKEGIKATPLISSTLNNDDFFFEDKEIRVNQPNFIYVGYLRKAKGIETVLRAFALLQKDKPLARLTIVGNGELEEQLKHMVTDEQIKHVTFLGHIDNRKELNHLLRSHDIFCFASLSEGSPRVILEAMANGLAVVSTPVGSLPTTFKDGEDILFANFNDAENFKTQLINISSNQNMFTSIRRHSFNKVSEYKIENFLKTIFYLDK